MTHQKIKLSKVILFLLYVATFAAVIYYIWDGFDYYKTSYLERPHQPAHQNIKPSGIRGHGLGILGTLMMILLLIYSLRKRYNIFRNLGSISTWLNFHIFLGITGPLFVILHTAFKLNGIVAISFWSMIAVALSGVLGRYLYLQIPRTITGNEINLQDLEITHNKISQEIFSSFKIDETYISKIENIIISPVDSNKGIFGILISLMIGDLLRFFRIRVARRRLRKLTGISRKQALVLTELTRKKAIMHRRIILWNKIHQLFHYWHVIHKPFAIIMYFIMIIHVGLTVVLGYKWVF